MSNLEFFIPALAGYLLLRLSHIWKFGLLREAGYHVVFRSTLVGMLLYSATGLALSQWPSSRVVAWLEGANELTGLAISAPAAGSLCLSLVVPFLLNLFSSKSDAAQRLLRRKGDLVELLIREAIREQSLLEFALDGGKTYVGFGVDSSFDDHGDGVGSVRFVPLLSGFRDSRHGLVFTTSYAHALRSPGDFESFTIATPRPQLKWIRRFDLDLYPWGEEPPVVLGTEAD